MSGEPELFELTPDDTGEVVARMSRLAAAGRGWINLQPAIDPDDLPPPVSGLTALLFSQGPDVPLCTWSPNPTRQREPVSIGIQHNAGRKAAVILRDRGVPVPDGWRVSQDHPRRGLVVEVPAADAGDHARIVRWLLDAATVLSTVPLTGTWRAAVYP